VTSSSNFSCLQIFERKKIGKDTSFLEAQKKGGAYVPIVEKLSKMPFPWLL
jgi:hypothetical protein